MKFETTFKLAQNKAFGIPIEINQLPIPSLNAITRGVVEEFSIEGISYVVSAILYRQQGFCELILKYIGGKIPEDFNKVVKATGKFENIVEIEMNIIGQWNPISIKIAKIPHTSSEFIELDNMVYQVCLVRHDNYKGLTLNVLPPITHNEFYQSYELL